MFDLLVKLQRKLELMILSEEQICNLLWSGYYYDLQVFVSNDHEEVKETLQEICPIQSSMETIWTQ